MLSFFDQGGGTAPRLLLEAFEDPPVMYIWEKDPQMMEVCQVAFGADDLAEGGYIKVGFKGSNIRCLRA